MRRRSLYAGGDVAHICLRAEGLRNAKEGHFSVFRHREYFTASRQEKLDGCILWNVHNTVFGSKGAHAAQLHQ